MPHQCVRCGTFYGDGSSEILKGCTCGSKLFFFVRKEKLEEAKAVAETIEKLSIKEKKQMENDVLNITGADKGEKPVILDFETIRVRKPGKFEIDLVNLFNKENPIVYKLDEGKYIIDVAETFNRRKELK